MKKLAVLILVPFIFALAETYTIGNQGNYPNLKFFFDAINNGSIKGNIEGKIISNLTEAASIEVKKSGVTSANYNYIEIYADKNVVIDFGSYNLLLNGAENIKFNGLINKTGTPQAITFKSTSSSFNIEIRNGAKNISIENCVITNLASSGSGGILLSCKDKNSSSSYDNVYNINISNNYFTQTGGPAVKLEGVDKNYRVKKVYIKNNNIVNFVSYGLQLSHTDSIFIDNNYIYTTNMISSGLWGILTSGYWKNLVISNNRIYGFQLSNDYAQIYGINLSSYNADDPSNKAIIYNNVISLDKSVTNTKLPIYGIHTSSNQSSIEIVYNTIYIGGTNVTPSTYNSSYGIYKDGNNALYILKNNIVINNRSNGNVSTKHYAAIFKNNGGITSSSVDYNLYSVNGVGGYLINYNSQDCSDLNDYLSKNTDFDQNSKSKIINFVVSNKDYLLYPDSISIKDTSKLKSCIYLKSVIDSNIGFNRDILGYDRTYFSIKGAYNDTTKKIITSTEDFNDKKDFVLYQNYPNPFNPSTNIRFQLPFDANVKLIVYNLLGQEVAKLLNGFIRKGNYTIQFSANHLSAGTYFYKLEVNGDKKYTSTKKMILLK